MAAAAPVAADVIEDAVREFRPFRFALLRMWAACFRASARDSRAFRTAAALRNRPRAALLWVAWPYFRAA